MPKTKKTKHHKRKKKLKANKTPMSKAQATLRGTLSALLKKKKQTPLEKILTRLRLPFKKKPKLLLTRAKNWSWTFFKKQGKKHLKAPKIPKLKRKTKKSSFLKRVLKLIFFPIIHPYGRIISAAVLLISVVGVLHLMKDLPSPRRLKTQENFAVSTQIFDRHGTLLFEVYGDQNRIPVDLEDLPDHVLKATISIEDANFYQHFGFDIRGITRAIKKNLEGGRLEGGSTITQQLVKNALLSPERSFKRKVKEAILAIITEVLYTKAEILELYLNYISYGGTAVGIESAANTYFDKHAKDLTVAEAALLAGLPQAPSRYSPFGSDPQSAKNRQAEVVRRMVEDGHLSKMEGEEAKGQILKYALSKTDIKAPHFTFFVRDFLYEKYGVETVERGGLRVKTTLDLPLQETAQASLSAQVEKLDRHNVGNGAAMIVKPNTGEILSMIGSTDYFDATNDGQVNVTLAHRQPGSSIKPIMYATAFQEKLLNPGSILLDVPTCFTVPGQKPYCPRNYDGSFKGAISVRGSLANSLNIPAVRGLRLIGLEEFIDQATKMGITTWNDPSNYGLSLTLGGGEIRMIDMAQAFGVLANQGVKVPLTPILEITNYQGEVLEKTDTQQRRRDLASLTEYDGEVAEGDLERVMDRAPAYLASHIMQDNSARTPAFGPRSKLVIPDQVVSAKTGTTNSFKDNWTVGFTPEFLTITWTGNNDGAPMYNVSGITGAAPIWNDIMSFVLADQEPLWQERPLGVKSGKVCSTGMPPTSDSDKCRLTGNEEFFWERSRPSQSRLKKTSIWIRPETGLPPQPGESTEGLVLEEHYFYEDPLTEGYCSDCNRATNEEGQVIYERQTIPNEQ